MVRRVRDLAAFPGKRSMNGEHSTRAAVPVVVTAVILLAIVAGIMAAHLWRISPLVWVCGLPALLVIMFWAVLFLWMARTVA